jgi:heptosyltransferase I
MKPDPQRILIVKPSALGDIVHTLPVLRLLRRRFPTATIDWLVYSAFADLLDGHPDLTSVVPLHRSPRGLFTAASEVRRRNYDMALDLQGLARSAFITRATGAAIRVGFQQSREFAFLAYTHKVQARMEPVHAVERYLDMAELVGAGRGPVEFVFHSTPADNEWAMNQTASLGKFAVIAPGTNWITKRWPVEHFEQLSRLLRDRGLKVVVVGHTDAEPLALAINPDLNLVKQTTLKQLVEVIALAEVVVANDSGPMHIASALGTPLVVPFGPTDPVLTGPYQRSDSVLRFPIQCSPCLSRQCSHMTCMHRITPQHAASAVESQLVQLNHA